ncbi:helix-turn-helix domain-containing protein [Acetobacter sicerae]|uniref:helix-turn-helix domain-containing protein n=1 Tax=Acetobacter sicerae TaxID=85325 RepID=UPI00156BB620|nr:helix-turn-helix transcriptional regulator [Acetobacter sicerae]NHN91922.1 helix-turn-helix domain-containing protein [Acetobacter sicerae]
MKAMFLYIHIKKHEIYLLLYALPRDIKRIGKNGMQNQLTIIIGTNMKKRRQDRSLTLEQLSAISGIDKERLKLFEDCKARPDAEELLDICKALEISISDLLDVKSN